MTIAQLIIVAFSALGGLLFVAAGFMFARSGVFPRLVSRSSKGGIADEALRAELSSVKNQLQIATKEIEARAAKLDIARQELDKHKERLSEAEKRIAEMGPLEDEQYTQQKQDIALKATIRNLREENAVAERYREELVAQLEVKEAEVVGLREARDGLSERLIESEERTQDLAAKIRKREDERQDLLVELERLSPRLSELDRCQERVGVLELSLDEMDAIRKSVAELRIENARLHSLELVHTTSPRPLLSATTSGVLGQSLNKLLEDLSVREGLRGAVVADENGFLAAGAGDQADALAAIAAIYDEIAAKVPDMLPVSKLPRIDIVDENGVTIAVQPIPIDTGRLILVSLSVGPGPEREAVDKLRIGD